jgi:hypothetical protein
MMSATPSVTAPNHDAGIMARRDYDMIRTTGYNDTLAHVFARIPDFARLRRVSPLWSRKGTEPVALANNPHVPIDHDRVKDTRLKYFTSAFPRLYTFRLNLNEYTMRTLSVAARERRLDVYNRLGRDFLDTLRPWMSFLHTMKVKVDKIIQFRKYTLAEYIDEIKYDDPSPHVFNYMSRRQNRVKRIDFEFDYLWYGWQDVHHIQIPDITHEPNPSWNHLRVCSLVGRREAVTLNHPINAFLHIFPALRTLSIAALSLDPSAMQTWPATVENFAVSIGHIPNTANEPLDASALACAYATRVMTSLTRFTHLKSLSWTTAVDTLDVIHPLCAYANQRSLALGCGKEFFNGTLNNDEFTRFISRRVVYPRIRALDVSRWFNALAYRRHSDNQHLPDVIDWICTTFPSIIALSLHFHRPYTNDMIQRFFERLPRLSFIRFDGMEERPLSTVFETVYLTSARMQTDECVTTLMRVDPDRAHTPFTFATHEEHEVFDFFTQSKHGQFTSGIVRRRTPSA